MEPELEQLRAQDAERQRELADTTNRLQERQTIQHRYPVDLGIRASQLDVSSARLAVEQSGEYSR